MADYQRSKDQVPEEVRPEMMLLAGNSQRQLGHFKEAQTIYQQIIQKYPGRDEAKDARYQRLIGLYNSNDPTLRAEIDEFINDNPEGERGDQANLLKAEWLYKEKDFATAATVYAGLRDSKLSPKLRAESSFKLGWCYVQTKQRTRRSMPSLIFSRRFPAIRRSHPPWPSERSPTRKPNNISAPGAISSNCSRAFPRRANGKRRSNKKLSSSGNWTTPRGWPRLFSSF